MKSCDIETPQASRGVVHVASIASGQRYMVMKVIMPVKDSISAKSLDSQFDDGNLQTGSIRYRASAAADTLKFLLLPIS